MKRTPVARPLFSILYGIAITLFFGLVYPHHLHYQEQYQLFLFDCDYIREILILPGGLADLLGRYCTQFFIYAWAGAIMLGALLMMIQILTAKLFDCGRFYGLTFLPACLLWLFLLDENALVGSLWAALLTLLAMLVWQRLKSCEMQRSMLILALPVLYWAVGPICLLFFVYCLIADYKHLIWPLACIIILMVLPVLLSHCLSTSLKSLLFGIHYYRLPGIAPKMLYWALLSYLLLIAAANFERKRDSNPLLAYMTAAIVLACQSLLLVQYSNLKAEEVMSYDFMARYQQWNRIIGTATNKAPNSSIPVTALNLALAQKGLLADHLFNFKQNGLAGLFPPFANDAVSPLTTSEVYYHLGMINTAQRYTFEAQEAIPDFQKSARCYKRLAETNLILGNYEVARKYLVTLQKTLNYSDWANETIKLLGDEEAIARHPEYGHLRSIATKKDCFFDERDLPDLLSDLVMTNRQNALALQYLKAIYLLTKRKS